MPVEVKIRSKSDPSSGVDGSKDSNAGKSNERLLSTKAFGTLPFSGIKRTRNSSLTTEQHVGLNARIF